MVTLGASVSFTKLMMVDVLELPVWSVMLATKVCKPSCKPVMVLTSIDAEN